ncbi:hypothetical protein [Phenylobacterium sp.]|uniref:hypothetical protein n=1 Tax=Phenylobacterium sp. TaxID=1871053 RepID=UPI002B9EFD4F|nr:hypothetical protein [Phenylobacterium sp.]HVI33689.1 hypothetical protein [Phenylobacterium sp.]
MHPALADAVADLVPPRVTFGELVARAVRVLIASPASVWAICACLAALRAGVRLTEQALGLAGEGVAPTPTVWATTTVEVFGGAALTGLALRRWLAPRLGWRLDRGFWAYLALAGLASFSFSAPSLLQIPMEVVLPGAPRSSPALTLLLQTTVFLALAYVYARLMLWPMTRLVGERALGPAGAWRAMRGGSWPYVGAVVLVSLPVMLATGGLGRLLERGLGPPGAWAEVAMTSLGLALVELFAAAASAIVYRQRARTEADVAEVFD